MLKKINTQEIITTRAAAIKYRTQYFLMVITDVIDQCDNDLGYVIYTADSEKELLNVPENEYKNKTVGLLFGDAAEPYPLIGNIVYHE